MSRVVKVKAKFIIYKTLTVVMMCCDMTALFLVWHTCCAVTHAFSLQTSYTVRIVEHLHNCCNITSQYSHIQVSFRLFSPVDRLCFYKYQCIVIYNYMSILIAMIKSYYFDLRLPMMLLDICICYEEWHKGNDISMK